MDKQISKGAMLDAIDLLWDVYRQECYYTQHLEESVNAVILLVKKHGPKPAAKGGDK